MNKPRTQRKHNEIIGAILFAIIVTLGALGIGALVLGAAGCSQDQLAQTQKVVADTRAEVAQLRAQAATMPADSPDRKLVEANAGKIEAALAKAEAILTAAHGGDATAVVGAAAASGIPYAGLAAAVLAFGLREYQNYQKAKAAQTVLSQVVASVDAAMPAMTDAQKDAMARVQDTATQLAVAVAKASQP